MGTSKTRANNRWNDNNYDSARVVFKRGGLQQLKAAATAAGKSVNAFIAEAIFGFYGLDLRLTDTPVHKRGKSDGDEPKKK